MRNLKIATAQFENKSGDKIYNLSVIERLSQKAVVNGADIIAFHECSVTCYSFARGLTSDQMLELSEQIPEVETVARPKSKASKNKIVVLAGLFEKDMEENIHKA